MYVNTLPFKFYPNTLNVIPGLIRVYVWRFMTVFPKSSPTCFNCLYIVPKLIEMGMNYLCRSTYLNLSVKPE